jgi:hypothetical protein
MCVIEIFIDRYPDGGDVEFRQTRLCQYGRPGRPCGNLSTLENTPRRIDYGEPTSEFILRQLNTPPRSSTSSSRPSLTELRDESPRPKRKRRSGDLFLSAFFGDPNRRRRDRRENVVVMDAPPSPRSPRTPRTPPLNQTQFPTHGSTSRLPRTPPPFVYDATPRGRDREPVIVDERDRPQRPQRASSVEVNISRRSSRRRQSSRSPSPSLAELRRRDEVAERERRRRRDEREAMLAAELEKEREHLRREQRRAQLNAEINARPPVPIAPLRRQPTLRPVVDQSQRLHDLLGDMNISARGERVIAEAVAERRRKEERERELARSIRIRLEAEEAEAQKQRLRRRFTIDRPPVRRHRVVYDDGTYRYE